MNAPNRDPSSNGVDNSIQLGREAAKRLAAEWPEVDSLPILEDLVAARAAIEHLGELMVREPALFRASRRGAERGAESLSSQPFQGVVEILQNADDLKANELRLYARCQGKRRELLIVHDGQPALLDHVGAMILPWVTTKENDPSATGRLGIGQMTLRALGGPIEFHCNPYHFRMDSARPHFCAPFPAIDGFYSPELPHRDTLLRVPLNSNLDLNGLKKFLTELGGRGLLFLKTVRRLYLIQAVNKIVVDCRLEQIGREEHVILSLAYGGKQCERRRLIDPKSGDAYTRYVLERPIGKRERRRHKATGKTTTIGVAFQENPSESGRFYDRVPLPLKSKLPFSLNAQFDPDTPRSTILENAWNTDRFRDLGDLTAAAALHFFS